MLPSSDRNVTPHVLDNVLFHGPLSDNTIHNATSTAHGFLCCLNGISTQYLTSTGGWADLYLSQRFTTNTPGDSVLFLDSSAYSNPNAINSTAMMYPICEFMVPQWIQNSRIVLGVYLSACSSSVDYTSTNMTGFYLKSGRGCMKSSAGVPLPSTLWWQVPGVIQFIPVNTGTSAATAFSTEMEVTGSEVFSLYALSTAAVQIKCEQFTITGNSTYISSPSPSTFGMTVRGFFHPLLVTTNF